MFRTITYIIAIALQTTIGGYAMWLAIWEGRNAAGIFYAVVTLLAIALTFAFYEANERRIIQLERAKLDLVRDDTAANWTTAQYAQVKHDRMDREGLEDTDTSS